MSPLNPQKAVSIDEFIEAERANFTSKSLIKLVDLIPNLRAKMETEQARVHYDLIEGVETLIRILQSPDVSSSSDPLPKHLAEAGVAAYYILKGADIIPDSIPEIGLTDDARIVARVFERNANLKDYNMPAPAKA
ncbi:MAG: DUF1232 domain-containing protein [Spartobacteria bacterium]